MSDLSMPSHSSRRHIVVTGGAGFLGSHIADVLAEQGHQVVVFDRQETPFPRDGVTSVVGDIRDADAVRSVCDGAQAVFHLAALADLNAAKTQPRKTIEINIGGTLNILEAVRELGIDRVMFASTVYVYSREGGFYRCSKQACEQYIEEYHRRYGVRYTILRYGSLYGPRSDRSNGVYRLLRAAWEHGKVSYQGTPDDVREYIHVEDAARLSVDAMGLDFENRHIVVTGNDALRFKDLATMFSEILGKEIEVEYGMSDGHYSMTPYTFIPKPGRKLTTNNYVDMGQGIIQVIEQIYNSNLVAYNEGSKGL